MTFDAALRALLQHLREQACEFTTVTPLTHARVLSNPPYLEDGAARAYRHGGGDLGRALSVKIGAQALQRLLPGGSLILYTGAAIVDGVDHFIREMEPFLGQAGCTYTYAEIDPDVFGEELERTVYRQAERIAAVGLVALKS